MAARFSTRLYKTQSNKSCPQEPQNSYKRDPLTPPDYLTS
jgi:hypothetical protein